MAETADRDQKTEAPTAKRLSEAARDGDILQSREWATALVMLAGVAWLMLAGPWFVRSCASMLRAGLTFGASDMRDFDPAFAVLHLSGAIALPLFSLMAVTLVAAIAGPALLGSLGFRGSAFNFKFNRINPATGIKRIFGRNGLIELVKALAKAALLGALGWWLVSGDIKTIMGLSHTDVSAAAQAVGGIMTKTLLWMALGLAAIAGIDVPVQII
ncbi:MAG: flagellar biosynthesis protein FlhB, partial [Pseudomonadota bacterium]